MSSLIIFIPAVDPGPDTGGSGAFTGLVLLLLMINVLLNLPVDIISAYALFRIGRGLGLRSAWLAWIPGGTLWVMGCLADDYQRLFKGRKSFFRWILLLHGVWSVFLWLITTTEGATAEAWISLFDPFLLVPVLLSIGGIVAVYIALYRVYRYAMTNNAAVFTALGIVYSIPTPFFLMYTAREW